MTSFLRRIESTVIARRLVIWIQRRKYKIAFILCFLFTLAIVIHLKRIPSPDCLPSNAKKSPNRNLMSDVRVIQQSVNTFLKPADEIPSSNKTTFDQFIKVERPQEEWNDTVEIKVTERRFVASEKGRVFILGVVAKNSTRSTRWDMFAVYGQWYDHEKLDQSSLRCCFRYANGKVIEQNVVDFQVRDYDPYMNNAKLLLWHITCTKPDNSTDPKLVSIVRDVPCTSECVSYLTPYYAMKQQDEHMVITTKFAYGNVDPEIVVSFLETVRYLGVDKVIIYVYHTLNPQIQRILRYYSYVGVVDYYTIELADLANTPHLFPPLDYQYMSDEWLIKRDALERSIGSTYFGIFDMDEYLVPSKNRTIKAMLRDLRHAQPTASHFFFQNLHFLTDARLDDKICAPVCDLFRRHVMTAPLRSNSIHQKMILITSRVSTQTINNHQVTSLPGFAGDTCPSTEAYVRHYGECLRKFQHAHIYLYGNICENRQIWVQDKSMARWSESTVSTNIQNTLKFLITGRN